VFDPGSLSSLKNAKDAPQISESDALTQFNGEPAFIAKDGIARCETAENRFVPIAAFESLLNHFSATTFPPVALLFVGEASRFASS
jgi:hypothetical protein